MTTPDAASIGSVNLVSLAADTHQIDMNQHFVPLSFTSDSGSLTVQAPVVGLARAARQLHVVHPEQTGRAVGLRAGADSGSTAICAYRTNERVGVAGQRIRDRIVGGTLQRRCADHVLHGDALRRRDGTDAGDGEREPAGDRQHRDRPDQRHLIHLHRQRDELGRDGSGLGAIERGDAGQATTPAFVQQVSDHKLNVGSLGVTPTNGISTGNRLVVEVGGGAPATPPPGR